MHLNWLHTQLPIYPIDQNSTRFPNLQKNWWDEVGDTSGVYFLIALDPAKTGEERRIIPRMLATDDTGTLYIGKADRNHDKETGGLRGRVGDLCKSVRPDREGTSHFQGRIRTLYYNIFPISSLAVCWLTLDTNKYKYASALEEDLMGKYTKKFGEAPPFNSQGFSSEVIARVI